MTDNLNTQKVYDLTSKDSVEVVVIDATTLKNFMNVLNIYFSVTRESCEAHILDEQEREEIGKLFKLEDFQPIPDILIIQ